MAERPSSYKKSPCNHDWKKEGVYGVRTEYRCRDCFITKVEVLVNGE